MPTKKKLQVTFCQRSYRLAIYSFFVTAALSASTFANDIILENVEIEIFKKILYEGRLTSTNMILIHENSTGNNLANIEQWELEELVSELGAPIESLQSWEERNRRRVSIKTSLDLKIKYRLLMSREFEDIFSAGDPTIGWIKFNKKYTDTDGFVRLSMPGFDSNITNALVLIEHHCGSTCGTGRFIHLNTDEQGNWNLAGSTLLWMAY